MNEPPRFGYWLAYHAILLVGVCVALIGMALAAGRTAGAGERYPLYTDITTRANRLLFFDAEHPMPHALTAAGATPVCGALSHDGRYLAYINWQPDEQALYLLTIDGGTITRISDAALSVRECEDLGWSADSRRLAFIDYTPLRAQNNLFLYDVASARLVQLTDSFDFKMQPVWLSDNRHVVYTSVAGNGSTDSHIYDLACAERLACDPNEVREITYNPDGSASLVWFDQGKPFTGQIAFPRAFDWDPARVFP